MRDNVCSCTFFPFKLVLQPLFWLFPYTSAAEDIPGLNGDYEDSRNSWESTRLLRRQYTSFFFLQLLGTMPMPQAAPCYLPRTFLSHPIFPVFAQGWPSLWWPYSKASPRFAELLHFVALSPAVHTMTEHGRQI